MKNKTALYTSNLLAALLCAVAFLFPYKIEASTWNKLPNNPILTGINNGAAFDASVLIKNNQYKLWYEGNLGYGWVIGYAYSPDGLNNWTINPTPVISIGTPDGWEKETTNPSVIFDESDQLYKMWYTSYNTDHWTVGADRFRVRYATSNNGITWDINPGWVLTGTPGQWDEGGIFRGISVLKINGTYKMWYAGTNTESLESNPIWKIGYATSTDGTAWIKQNNGNPVITPTLPWELKNINSPNVIYNNGLYEMWYTATNGNKSQIVYATSLDGINWSKPEEGNPAITPSQNFDIPQTFAPNVVNDNGIYKMWYSGFDNVHFRIGYATTAATSQESPTPTPTPTPTPIPTPTSTPTPITIPTKKVVVIPGVTASWNLDAFMRCKSEGYVGDWSLVGYAEGIYNPVVNELRRDDWIPLLFTYDWRKHVSDNAAKLKTFIDTQTSPGEKVDIVGHSMGGLVARAYIELEGANNKVEKLFTVGSPHQGSVASYPSWSAGESPTGDPTWRFLVALAQNICVPKTMNSRLAVQKYFPSIQDVLPTFDYLVDNQTNQPKPVLNMSAKNEWLLNSSFNPPYYGTIVGTLTGTGRQTESGYRVGPRNSLDALLGNWEDGKMVKTLLTTNGDNRVLTDSGSLPDADNRTIQASHTDLISSQEGISEIKDFLNGPAFLVQGMMQPLIQKRSDHQKRDKKVKHPTPEPTSGLFIIGDKAKFWIMDPRGKVTHDTDGLISYLDPKPGYYKLFFWPKEKKSQLIISQVLPKKDVLWKEYTFKTRLPQFRWIKFNPTHPKEDILHH